jgi:hypothetical protein
METIIIDMSWFTSKRERRLWLWAMAVMVAIYSTLGLARTLAGALRNEGLLGASFLLGLVLLVAAVVTQGLRMRLRGAELGVALGVLGVYLLLLLRMTIPEERTHLIEYTAVALLIYEALMERASHGRRVPAPALLAVALTALLGLLDEGIQGLLPNRVYDIRDVGFNALAGGMAVGASLALAWARRRRNKDLHVQ